MLTVPARQITAATPTSITLTWGTPRVVGQITGYEVSTFVDGKRVSSGLLPASVHTYTLTGLKPDSTYMTTLTSRASSGVTTASLSGGLCGRSLKDPRTVAYVSNPASTKIVKTNSTSVQVSWGLPTRLQGKIVRYEVRLRGNDGTTRNLNTTTLNRTFTGLNPGTVYTASIKTVVVSLDGKNTGSSQTMPTLRIRL
ncbi:fibronectin type III domain-containing protein [Agromyces sp. NPDC057679]|uniref:fibronectin type III domain-containing protein n=1 Tax=Agromyces sp. NPDC057679 TaxID=3346207 RepID=UPI003670F7BD